MTANETEEAGAADDSVRQFAAWMRAMHREARKPSYATIVKRSRVRYPEATVRESTVSDILNGKRLPRWDTVEPIAWALGGEKAVAQCLQQWKQADAARGQVAVPGPADPADGDPPAGQEALAPRLGRQRQRWWAAAAGAALVLPLAVWGVTILSPPGEEQGGTPSSTPRPDAPDSSGTSTATTTAAPGGPTGSPTRRSPSPAAIGSLQLTAKVPWEGPIQTAWTPDDQIGIRITATGDPQGLSYFVITPQRSCTVTRSDIGESVVIKEPGYWIRLIATDVGGFGPDLHDQPVTFRITRGTGEAPRSTQSCT